MTTTVTRTIGALALLAGIAACGSTDGSRTTQSGSPPVSSGPVMSPPHDAVMAQAVTLVRSGGLKGGTTTLMFRLHRLPPAGYTAAQLVAILKAAADPALKTAPTSTPTNPCCDRYVYRVTISWVGGPSRTFTTVDGDPQQPAVSHLLDLLT